MEKQLDVRQIMQSQLDLRTLLRRTLSPAQQNLLRYQSDRFAGHKNSPDSSEDSSSDDDKGLDCKDP